MQGENSKIHHELYQYIQIKFKANFMKVLRAVKLITIKIIGQFEELCKNEE